MLENYKKRSKEHLFRLIARRNEKTPNFALLLGAGASATSKVKTAAEMINEWQHQLHLQSKSTEDFDVWVKAQTWYNDEDAYGILFEKVCDQPSQRRIYVEECLKEAKPSWGYIYLANVIAGKYFNVVFTPNFDDLLNEACFLYTGCKPIVCAHDSAVSGIRVTSHRAKIIKLHGDFLYDSIKNTIKETDVLERNMQSKLMQFSREYGLVVIGYGGNDSSIMSLLDSMIKPSETENYFPNGIYWCHHKGGKISKKLDRLLQREKAYLVEIEGFDEFMAELHQFLGLTLPDSVRDPYRATTERLNGFVIQDPIKHPVIKQDADELDQKIKKHEQAISTKIPEGELDQLIPYGFLVTQASNEKNYDEVIKYSTKALAQDPRAEVMQLIVKAYLAKGQFEKALEIGNEAITKFPESVWCNAFRGRALVALGRFKDAIEGGKKMVSIAETTHQNLDVALVNLSNYLLLDENWQEALDTAEKGLTINPLEAIGILNRSIALKKMGRFEEAKVSLTKVLPNIAKSYLKAAVFAVLEDKENMLGQLALAVKEDVFNKFQARTDPDFEKYREDEDFLKLVEEEKKN
jgi:tetratricopeptide (TPR) repeat protein